MFRTKKSTAALALIVAALSLSLAPESIAGWEPVALPEGASYARTIEAGDVYLYAAFRAADETELGLYRAPLENPSDWEPMGFAGMRISDIEIGGLGDGFVWIAGSGDNPVFRSTDGGESWSSGTGLPGNVGMTLAWNGATPGRLYCSTRGEQNSETVAVSTDLGATWEVLDAGTVWNSPRWLETQRDGSSFVYFAFSDGYWETVVHRSSNGGEDWLSLLPSSHLSPPYDLQYSSRTGRIHALVRRNDTSSAVLRWQGLDEVGTWVLPLYAAGMELPAWAPGIAYFAGVAPDGTLAAGYLDEDGTAWTALDDGLPEDPSPTPEGIWWKFDLSAATGVPKLFVSTPTLGIWARDLRDIAGATPTIDGLSLAGIHAYPNPFTDETRILLTGPPSSETVVRVVDLQGRRIRTLEGSAWDGRTEAGSAAPAGIYFLEAWTGGGRIASMKVVRLP